MNVDPSVFFWHLRASCARIHPSPGPGRSSRATPGRTPCRKARRGAGGLVGGFWLKKHPVILQLQQQKVVQMSVSCLIWFAWKWLNHCWIFVFRVATFVFSHFFQKPPAVGPWWEAHRLWSLCFSRFGMFWKGWFLDHSWCMVFSVEKSRRNWGPFQTFYDLLQLWTRDAAAKFLMHRATTESSVCGKLEIHVPIETTLCKAFSPGAIETIFELSYDGQLRRPPTHQTRNCLIRHHRTLTSGKVSLQADKTGVVESRVSRIEKPSKIFQSKKVKKEGRRRNQSISIKPLLTRWFAKSHGTLFPWDHCWWDQEYEHKL